MVCPDALPEHPEGWTRRLGIHLNFGGGKGGASYAIHNEAGEQIEHLAYQYDTRKDGYSGFTLPDVERALTWAELREEWPKFLERRRVAALTASCQAPTIAAQPERTPMETRLYYVKSKEKPEDLGRLVEAKHPAQAFRHVGKDLIEVSLPTALEASKLVKAGVKVEDANGGPREPAPLDPDEAPF